MYKIIDLGAEFSSTGEPRVRLIKEDLVKTAATEIQNFWDSLSHDDNYAYLWVIGVSAREYYGCNNNGDAFDEQDLKNTYQDFVNNAHIFLQHVNKDPAKSIGKPVYAWYNDVMHRVELILRVDKKNPSAAETLRKIKDDEQIYVSMGCSVAFDKCSICGNTAPTRRDYCDHLKFNMKKILPDGRQVFALNPNPKFFDISIVAKPADPMAFALDKAAADRSHPMNDAEVVPMSAELGEIAESLNEKRAALKKVSDILKEVEGQVVDKKDTDVPDAPTEEKPSEDSELSSDDRKRVRLVVHVGKQGFDDMEYPEMPYKVLDGLGLSPAGLISSLGMFGAPVTLGDAAWMSGKHFLGHCPSDDDCHSMFGNLPRVVPFLQDNPDIMGGLVRSVCSPYNGEFDEPEHAIMILKIIKPVAKARVRIITNMAPDEALNVLNKQASSIGIPDYGQNQFGRDLRDQIVNDFRSRKQNFATITITDKYGHVAKTTPYALRQALVANATEKAIPTALGTILALGAVSGAVASPTLMTKLLSLVSLGAPAAALLNLGRNTNNAGVVTSEGAMLPDSIAHGVFKEEVKTASLPATMSPSFAPRRLGTTIGMAVPAALAMDYMYNKWKYGPFGIPEESSGIGQFMNDAGEFVTKHPVASTFGAALLGSQAGKGGKALANALLTKFRK